MTKVRYQPDNTPPIVLEAIPPTDWGRDHWSTLVFLEMMTVDNMGLVQVPHMRTDPDVHPKYVYHTTKKRYPTRLQGGKKLSGHDDWSCMEDMIDAGMMVALMRGRSVWVFFTPFGSAVAGALRAFKARGGLYRDFSGYYFDMEAEGGTEDV